MKIDFSTVCMYVYHYVPQAMPIGTIPLSDSPSTLPFYLFLLRPYQIGPDLQPLSPRRQELFFNNLIFSEPSPGTFISSEFVRTATLGRSVSVTDSETLSKYLLQPDGTVEGIQRVALYLTPNPNNKVKDPAYLPIYIHPTYLRTYLPIYIPIHPILTGGSSVL